MKSIVIAIICTIYGIGISAQKNTAEVTTDYLRSTDPYDIHTVENLWVLKFVDSIRYKTDLCSQSKSQPSFKRYQNKSGEYLYRLRYTKDDHHTYIYIFNHDGTPRAHCLVTPDLKDCNDFEEYSDFTFTKESMNIWSCKNGFNCAAKDQLGLYRKFSSTVTGDQCVDSQRTLDVTAAFSSYAWYQGQDMVAQQPRHMITASSDYKLVVTDIDGCKDSTITRANVHTPRIIATDGNKIICPGEITTITSDGFAAYRWSTGDIGPSTEIDEGGTYELIVTDQIDCEDTTTFEILSLEDRSIEIELPQEQYFRDEVVPVKLNFQNMDESNVQEIIWGTVADLTCDNCTEPFARFAEDTELFAMAIDEYDCIYEADIVARPDSVYKDVYSANVFTPDGDGENDLFLLRSMENMVVVHNFRVFNRWGVPVYDTGRHMINDEAMGWDGKHNGQEAPAGIYVYVAEIEFMDRSKKQLTGDILLVR